MWSKLASTFGPRRQLKCSFCGRDEDHVGRLVKGAAAHICDACISECVSVLQRHGGFDIAEPNHTN